MKKNNAYKNTTFQGCKGYFLPIVRNKDEKGIILTYSVFMHNDKTEFEFNTLREAKIIAFQIKEENKK